MADSINDKILANKGLVYSIVKRYFRRHRQNDDVIQSGMIGLWKGIETFDESRGIKFASYACKCIFNEITNWLRPHENKFQKHNVQEPILDSGEPFFTTLAYNDTSLEQIELAEMFGSLADFENDVLTAIFLNKNKQVDIANENQQHRSWVSQIYHRCIDKLKKKYEANNEGVYTNTLVPNQKSGKLNWEIVRKIRSVYAEGNHTKVALTKEFGLSLQTIRNIIGCVVWKEEGQKPIVLSDEQKKQLLRANNLGGRKRVTNKLDLIVANEIRQKFATGSYKKKQLGRIYGVSDSTISEILNNKIWRTA